MDILEVLGVLVIIYFLSLVVEALVEYIFGTPMDKLGWTKFKWLLMYCALGVGVGLCWIYKLDMVALIPKWLGLDNLIEPGRVGQVLTGFIIGRGSNYTHDLIMKFFTKKNPIEEVRTLEVGRIQ